ncbi:hypothetical protein EDB92DRAFT_1816275 [Lactarius akahatsu]|uniref:Uncharacterized protein n=1 Tax=Lactarius akahatsu TaxID=416441 RepID=A0AAD4LF95_9AGAM|nr:hypothetical protein EDB92DRAFT_1816275 [Lactarius akahatsu]
MCLVTDAAPLPLSAGAPSPPLASFIIIWAPSLGFQPGASAVLSGLSKLVFTVRHISILIIAMISHIAEEAATIYYYSRAPIAAQPYSRASPPSLCLHSIVTDTRLPDLWTNRHKGDPRYGRHILAAPIPSCHHEMGEGKGRGCAGLPAAQGAASVDSKFDSQFVLEKSSGTHLLELSSVGEMRRPRKLIE